MCLGNVPLGGALVIFFLKLFLWDGRILSMQSDFFIFSCFELILSGLVILATFVSHLSRELKPACYR